MAAEPVRGRRRPDRSGLSERSLTLLAAVLLLALLATVVGGWWTLRSPGLEPVSIPSVGQA